MENYIVQILFTSVLTAAASWAAIKVEIKWIVRTLNQHAEWHESHFANFKTVERRKKSA